MTVTKPLLNTHVFGQSVFNWIPLPAEVGETIEVPIPPVDGLSEVLVFLSAVASGPAVGEHYYAAYTRTLDGGPVAYHYLFLAGGNADKGSAVNSENVWLKIPEKGLPRMVYIQKMSGAPLKASANFKSGATVLALR